MDVKSFIHQWCTKKSVTPVFETRPTGKFTFYYLKFWVMLGIVYILVMYTSYSAAPCSAMIRPGFHPKPP